MDIARPDLKRKRRRKQIVYAVLGLVAMAIVTMGLKNLEPAAPSVEKGSLYWGTVERGPMLRTVRGNGALVPEEIRWIPAAYSGRIERILVLPGAEVKADTILIELSNPELQQAAFEAEWQLKGAEAQLDNLRVTLQSHQLTQQATAASATANYSLAKLEAEINEELSKSGLVAMMDLKRSKARSEELAKLNEIEQERLRINAAATTAQLAVQEAQVAQLRAQLELKRQQVDSLKVRAGIDGVLQKLGDQIPLQIGQQVAQGSNLARVANPTKLKAEIKVVATQARDIQFNQKVLIDTRNGVIDGHVIRIDPAVQNETVTVDVALDGALPKGARPDLSVDATVELERLDDVVYVGRGVNFQSDSTIGVFRFLEGGKSAVRVPVKLGRSSVQYIEVIQGLNPGDVVILSDMNQWDAYERVRLN